MDAFGEAHKFVVSGSRDVLSGAKLAIGIEEAGIKFYSDNARKVSSPLSAAFEFLAGEEGQHRALISEFIVKFKSGTLPEIPVQKIPNGLFKVSVGKDSSYASVLLSAMDAEKKSMELYSALSMRSSGAAVSFFKSLVKFEQAHYALLDGLLNQADSFRMET